MPATEVSDFDILRVGSCKSITRAPACRMVALGTVNVGPNRALNRSARSRVSSTCWRWSSPTGTSSVSYRRMSAASAPDRRTDPADTKSARSAFSLNWVMRRSSPNAAVHSIIQPSSACSCTWLWTKSVHSRDRGPTARKQRGQLDGASPSSCRVLGDGEGVEVDDAVEGVGAFWSSTQLRSAPR